MIAEKLQKIQEEVHREREEKKQWDEIGNRIHNQRNACHGSDLE